MDYSKHATRGRSARTRTPQSRPIADEQVKNSAGGYVWEVDKWVQLLRFLILGTERGTYYIGEAELTGTNVVALDACIAEDPNKTLGYILAVSDYGLAAKQDAVLFAHAYYCAMAPAEYKQAAVGTFSVVVRTASQLFRWAYFTRTLRGTGRGFRRAVSAWYNRDVADVAYQMLKYPERDGYTHRDLLRLAHVKPKTADHSLIFAFARAMADGTLAGVVTELEAGCSQWTQLPASLMAYAALRGLGSRPATVTEREAITSLRLPREALPTEWLTQTDVWRALLPNMPMTAMVRNLATMTKLGVLQPMSLETADLCARLRDQATITKSRLHPVQLVAASFTYSRGKSVKGSAEWAPISAITDALDDAFRLSFATVTPTGKRMLVAVDVSASMWSNGGFHQGDVRDRSGYMELDVERWLKSAGARNATLVNGMDYLTAAQGAAILATVIAGTEPNAQVVAFDTQVMTNYPITGKTALRDAVRCGFVGPRGTDCTAPITWALKNKIPVDVFVILTDNETWAGRQHPAVAMDVYRKEMQLPDARLAVVAMAANQFTITAPNDARAMDFIGFDPSAPAALAAFSKGTI
jgi:60 kDa SS-A/Ro ribonucleoprotein